MEKRCVNCDTVKTIFDFHKDKRSKDGLLSYCKPCNIKRVSDWQKQNRNRVNEGLRRRYAENLEKAREQRRIRVRRWYAKHSDSQRKRSSDYRKENPEVKRMAQSKRRAMKQGNGIFEVRHSDILRLLSAPCVACGSLTNQTIDHVIPISLGGRHSIGNFQTLCASCNSSKHSKTMSQWKKERKLYEPLRQG